MASIEVVDVSRSSSDAGIKSKSALTTVVNCVEEGYSEDSLQRVLLVQSDVRAPLAPPSDCEDSDPAQYAQPVSLTGTQRLQTQNVPGAPSPSRAQAQGGVSASASQIPVPASQPGSAFKPSVVQTSHPTSGLAVTTTTPPPQNQHAPQTAAFGHAAPLHPSIEGRPPTAPSSSRSLFSNLKKVLSNGRPTEQTSNGGTASMSPPRSAQNQTHKTKKGNRGGL
ncbi:hypothetical protein C8Q73DRAFT_398217 [Cubamyces lactineus]|nr:hypothetical protein C8Q73DRAFT_398217 [Cubamyces lactineus]